VKVVVAMPDFRAGDHGEIGKPERKKRRQRLKLEPWAQDYVRMSLKNITLISKRIEVFARHKLC
jgi:hypothetical protein